MSEQIVKPADCCAPCTSPTVEQVPGPKGDAGTNGTNGTNGANCYTTTTAQFTQPAVNSTVNVSVQDTESFSIGLPVFLVTGGFYLVNGIPDGVTLQLTNLGYTPNAAPGTTIVSSTKVVPAGLKGLDGSSGSVTLNSIAPTRAKGDIMADNGANGPSGASVVNVAIGSDGKILVADSSQAAGLNYKQLLPNSVSQSGAIPIFNGASGTPAPLVDSKVAVTSDGAVQTTPTGGNTRGNKAVDLQVQRSAVDQVASGDYSKVGGGQNNKASGQYATVPGGTGNTASGQGSVASGTNNTASGVSSVALGDTNLASGDYSKCHGRGNTASATGSSAEGLFSKAYLYGQKSVAAGDFANPGDAQISDLVLRIATGDATPTNLFLDGTSLTPVVPNNTAWAFEGVVIARSSAGNNAAFSFNGVIKNNAGTTALVAAVTPSSIAADGGFAPTLAVTADAATNALFITGTGIAATAIRWVCRLKLTEINF